MAVRVNTNTLMKRLFKAADLDTYLEGNESDLHSPDFYTLLKQACEKRNMLPAQVIERAQIERTYGHQLFNGTRRPSRDKVLQLALGLGLSVDETQRLLRAAGKSPLYPRLKRDAALIFCLKNGYDMMETQEILEKHGISLLGG